VVKEKWQGKWVVGWWVVGRLGWLLFSQLASCYTTRDLLFVLGLRFRLVSQFSGWLFVAAGETKYSGLYGGFAQWLEGGSKGFLEGFEAWVAGRPAVSSLTPFALVFCIVAIPIAFAVVINTKGVVFPRWRTCVCVCGVWGRNRLTHGKAERVSTLSLNNIIKTN